MGGGHSGPFTLAGCKANLPSASIDTATYAGRPSGSPSQNWWDGCLWKTANVDVTGNVIDFSPAQTSDAVKLSSCVAGLAGRGGEGGGFVVVLAGDQAVVQAA